MRSPFVYKTPVPFVSGTLTRTMPPSAVLVFTRPFRPASLIAAFGQDRVLWTPPGPDRSRSVAEWLYAAEVSSPDARLARR